MSYYSKNGDIRPGKIDGNALAGLENRVSISAIRVLDSCSRQISNGHAHLKLDELQGEPPFKFIAATSCCEGASVSDLNITRMEKRKEFARIKCNVVIPLQVTYEDKNQVRHASRTELVSPQDVVMYVPEASVFPFEIAAVASVTCPSGEFVNEHRLDCTLCMTLILKVIAQTDLLIPSYGFCPSPRAIDFEDQECQGFFELPLYPSGR